MKNYKLSMSIGTAAMGMHPVNCFFDTAAGRSLIWEKFLTHGWLKMIRPARAPDLKSSRSESVHFLGIITIHFRMGDCRLCVIFGVVENLGVPVLLGTFFIDWFVNEIFPAEQKIVLYNSARVSIVLLLRRTTNKKKTKNQNCQWC